MTFTTTTPGPRPKNNAVAPIYRSIGIQMVTELPRPLVFTNGVFDLLHPGHAAFLTQAAQLGAALVVGLNRDASARRQSPSGQRPVESEIERAVAVASLPAVTAVALFEDDAPLRLIRALRPEVYVRDGDYAARPLPEADLVAQWGGRTVIIPRAGDWATSALIAEMSREPGGGASRTKTI